MNGSMSILGRTSNGRAIIAPTKSLTTVLDKNTDKLIPVIKFMTDDGLFWVDKINKISAQLVSHVFKTNLDISISKAQAIDLMNRRARAERRLTFTK